MHSIFIIYYIVVGAVSLYYQIYPVRDVTLKRWFFVLSVPMVIFTAFRPIGIMRDDTFYSVVLSWQTSQYVEKIIQLRDPLYYMLIWGSSQLSSEPRFLLFITGFILTAKLFFIHKIGGRSCLLLLFMYLSIYWQLHDLTQFRVSLSALFFLAFFYSIQYRYNFFSKLFIVLSMLSHSQALLNFIFMPKLIVQNKGIFYGAILLTISLLTLNLSPSVNLIEFMYSLVSSALSEQLRDVLSAYIHIYKGGYGVAYSKLPIIFVTSCFIYSFIIFNMSSIAYMLPHIQKAILSLLMAAFLAFIFSDLSDVQVRLYEYYFIAGLVVAATAKSVLSIFSIYILSILYFIKFNVKWRIWDSSVMDEKFLMLIAEAFK